MAGFHINQLDRSATAPDLASGDRIPVLRGTAVLNVTYTPPVPASTTADAGKVVRVATNGTKELAAPADLLDRTTTPVNLWQGTITPPTDTTINLDGSNAFSTYTHIVFSYEFYASGGYSIQDSRTVPLQVFKTAIPFSLVGLRAGVRVTHASDTTFSLVYRRMVSSPANNEFPRITAVHGIKQ